jgi:hypothetical protein
LSRKTKLVKAIALSIVTLLIASVARIAIVFFVFTITLTNSGTDILRVSVSLGDGKKSFQSIGSAKLDPGERMWRAFLPAREGELTVYCRNERTGQAVIKQMDYITPDLADAYRFTISSCSELQNILVLHDERKR